VARQRPQTAKGYVFVLFEDEDGPINVIVKPDIYKRDRTTIRMEPFVSVRGRLQKDGETINVIAFEVRSLRLGGGTRPPASGPGSTQAEAAASMREAELFPSLPGTQEWWPDRGKVEGQEAVGLGGADTAGLNKKGPGPNRRKESEPDRSERQRQEAHEEAATERRREARQRESSPEPSSKPVPGPALEPALEPASEPSPELPKVREWWGKPEEAKKSPFYYLTALRQSPPGTKSWG